MSKFLLPLSALLVLGQRTDVFQVSEALEMVAVGLALVAAAALLRRPRRLPRRRSAGLFLAHSNTRLAVGASGRGRTAA